MNEPELFAETPDDVASFPSLRAEHFPYAGPYPCLDQPDAESRIEAKLRGGQITQTEAEQCRYWTNNGYIILKGLIEHETLDKVWNAYEAAVANGTVPLPRESAAADDPYPGRFLDPHDRVPDFCQVLRHPDLLRWMELLTEREPKPIQTITSHKGSQQGAHSDSIHMTTYPLGYLTAAWIAFEDIHPDSGPLVYYPGSHRLPYLFSKDVGITESDFKERGYQSDSEKYEPAIRKLIEYQEPHHFHANKGDVLIWHANLIHGGSKRLDMQRSRKALVCHFFAKGAIAYHDLASSPTKPYSGTCLIEHQKPGVSEHAPVAAPPVTLSSRLKSLLWFGPKSTRN